MEIDEGRAQRVDHESERQSAAVAAEISKVRVEPRWRLLLSAASGSHAALAIQTVVQAHGVELVALQRSIDPATGWRRWPPRRRCACRSVPHTNAKGWSCW